MRTVWLLCLALGCAETEDSNPSEPVENTVYGSCSLDGARWNNNDITAFSTEAASVAMVFVYRHRDYGLQDEQHPMQFVSSEGDWDEWGLMLERVNDPNEVVMGETTLYLSGDRDRLFLGLTEDGEVCDCYDPAPPWRLGVKDCSDYGGEAVDVM